MPRLAPQILKPREAAKTDPLLDLAVGSDPITFAVGPWDSVTVHLVLVRGAWSGGQTIPLEVSDDGANFSDYATAYTAAGVQAPAPVGDYGFISLRVVGATGTPGDNQVRVIVRAKQDAA